MICKCSLCLTICVCVYDVFMFVDVLRMCFNVLDMLCYVLCMCVFVIKSCACCFLLLLYDFQCFVHVLFMLCVCALIMCLCSFDCRCSL